MNEAMMDGFGREWATIGDRHRVLIVCRNGFPNHTIYEPLRTMAIMIAGLEEPLCTDLRIVEAFDDDKSGTLAVTIGTTAEIEPVEDLERWLAEGALSDGPGSFVVVEVRTVAEGNTGSDHYDHMRHLAESILLGRSSYAKIHRPGSPEDPCPDPPF